jgi:hypothetical protein
MKRRKFHQVKNLGKSRVSDGIRHPMAPPEKRFRSKKAYNRQSEKRRLKKEHNL